MDYLPDLTDKVAIATGGGKGIGRSIAFGLAEAGCKVIIAARTESEIQDAAKDITSRGGQAIAKVTDLTRNEEIQGLVETAVTAFSRIDILINNAARSFFRPLLDLREDGFDKIFDTNVKAVFLLGRECARS